MKKQSDTLDIVCRAGSALQAALQARDDYTQSHCQRVASIAALSGKAFSLSDVEITNLKTAAVFHDIGKIGIADNILMKAGRFTPEEYEVMKRHSVIGESVVEKLDIPNASDIAAIVRGHHEHVDGTGYPDGLRGDEISLSCRIITSIDVYDALRTRRCYREAIEKEQVFDWMEGMLGTIIDPDVFKVVKEIILELDNRPVMPDMYVI